MGITGLKVKNTKYNTELLPDYYSRITWLRKGIPDSEVGFYSNILDTTKDPTRRSFIKRLLLIFD
jgi:hypothetical protein